MSPLLSMRAVRKAVLLPDRSTLRILDAVDLDIESGESVAILGRSGSGKTTLLNLIGLLDRPDAGLYEVDGVDATRLRERDRARLRGQTFGFVFQHFNLLERRTALVNVAAPLLHAPLPQLLRRSARAGALLETVGLAGRQRSTPAQLSGGEQQRVAIARALVRSPRVMLADEPTGSLDLDTGGRVLDLMLSLVRSRRMSLVLITHDPEVAARMDRQLLLGEGTLRERRPRRRRVPA